MTRLGQHDRAADAMERIYREWDEAMGARDVGAALELYAPDATIESPLVSICSEGKLESTGVTTTCGTLSPSSFSGHRRKGAGIALVFHGRTYRHLGISPSGARLRPDGSRRGDGDQRRWADPASPRLLGLVRSQRPPRTLIPALRQRRPRA